MSKDLKPYVGQTGAAKSIWKADTGTDDNGTAFRALITTRAEDPGGEGYSGVVGDSMLLAKAANGVTITDTIIADYGIQTQAGTALLTASAAGESRVLVRLEGTGLAQVGCFQHEIGDATAVSNAWTLDSLTTPYGRQEAKSQ
jgi:hypothetical protein